MPDTAPPIPAALALDDPPFTADDLAEAIAEHGDLDGIRAAAASLTGPARFRPIAAFVPSTDADAEFLMRLLTGARTSSRGVREQAGAWRDRIDLWESDQVAPHDRVAGIAEALLEDYGARSRTSTARATVPLPSGVIRTRAQNTGGAVKVTDDEACAAHLAEALSSTEYERVVNTKVKVLVGELRKVVRIVTRPKTEDDGTTPVIDEASGDPITETVVVDETGHTVPGVDVLPESFTVTVSPEDDPGL